MRTPEEQYRAYARECMKWADSAKTIEHRETLLGMATAVGGNRRPARSSGPVPELASNAKANAHAVCKPLAANGGRQSTQTIGRGQPKQPEAASDASINPSDASDAKYQPPRRERGETSAD